MNDWKHTSEGLHPNNAGQAALAAEERRMLEWILAQPAPKLSVWQRIVMRVRGWFQ